jgi:hypothetical protein
MTERRHREITIRALALDIVAHCVRANTHLNMLRQSRPERRRRARERHRARTER